MKYSSELKFLFKHEDFDFPYKLMIESDDGIVFQRLDRRERTYISIVQTSDRYYIMLIVGKDFLTDKSFQYRYGSSSVSDLVRYIRLTMKRSVLK